jgi:DNA-binding transcriptional LysR family regulator
MNPLRYIAEVARCGSIREAADNLHVAASAISRHIRNAEHELGAALFDRTPRGVKCTAAGTLYVDYARSVLAGRDRVRTDIENLNELRRGHVKIHTIDGIVGAPYRVVSSTSRKCILACGLKSPPLEPTILQRRSSRATPTSE